MATKFEFLFFYSINVAEENVETIDQTIISGDNVIVVKTDDLTFVTSTFQDEKIQEKIISESKIFLCDKCDKSFRKNCDLQKHIRFVHDGIKGEFFSAGGCL